MQEWEQDLKPYNTQGHALSFLIMWNNWRIHKNDALEDSSFDVGVFINLHFSPKFPYFCWDIATFYNIDFLVLEINQSWKKCFVRILDEFGAV